MALLAYTTQPPAILQQAMNSESNALAEVFDGTAIRAPIPEQNMADGMFGVFAKTYGLWLDQMMPTRTEAPDRHFVSTNEVDTADFNISTNIMEITEAVRAEIDGLVDKTLGSLALVNMGIARDDVLLSGQARINAGQALKNMQLIYDLLPKPPRQDQQQQQEQNQEQQQEQNQDQQQQQSNPDEGSQNKDDPSDSGKDESNENQQPQQPEQQEEQQSEPVQETKSAEQEAAERIMAQILEQEKEREEARREVLRTMPPRVGERDW